MAGCGKYNELIFIKYQDNKLEEGEKLKFENHLLECKSCMKEVLELNRIQNVIENSNVNKFYKKNFINIIFREKKLPFVYHSLKDIILEPLALTRNKEKNDNKLLFYIEKNDKFIQIIPDNNKFWIQLINNNKINITIQLIRKGEEAPFYYKSSNDEIINIRNIDAGKYVLIIDSKKIDLDISFK